MTMLLDQDPEFLLLNSRRSTPRQDQMEVQGTESTVYWDYLFPQRQYTVSLVGYIEYVPPPSLIS